MRIKEIEPKGEYVALKFTKIKGKKEKDMYKKDKKSGILLLNDVERNNANPQKANKTNQIEDRWVANIYAIGSEAVKLVDFKIGDLVVYNDYDLKFVGHEDDNMFGLIKWSNIMAAYEEEPEKKEEE